MGREELRLANNFIAENKSQRYICVSRMTIRKLQRSELNTIVAANLDP